MMGEPVGRQDRLFYEFDLADVVPADHRLRRIDAVLDLSWLRGELKAHYSAIGRPSICPELMIRMLLVGSCASIRSERRLCQEVAMNLAYRRFCRLGLADRVPDHSSFSVNRHGRFRERRISRDVDQEARDYTQGLMQSEAYGVSSAERKKIETRFGEVKHSLSLVRLRLRGLSGPRDEFLPTATVQNLKRLAHHTTIPPTLRSTA